MTIAQEIESVKEQIAALQKELAILTEIAEEDDRGDTDRLRAIPAADVVPVVRCKDCKYCVEHYDMDGNVPYWVCKEWDSGTDYDGYCHYGQQRKEQDE